MTELRIDYQGEALRGGVLAQDLRQVLDGYDRLLADAAHLLNGSDVAVSFKITSVRANSLTLLTILEVVAAAQAAFPLSREIFSGISSAGQLVKLWLDIQKHLRGEPPTIVQKVGTGNAVKITNNHGQILVVNGNVLNAFNTLDIGAASEKIAVPFRRRAERLTLTEDGQPLASYDTDDASSFHRVQTTEAPLETTGEVLLTVKAPVLEGDGKWRFRFGSATIVAEMLDHDFREKVDRGEEVFRRGDIYRVKLRSRQERVGRRLKTDHFIEEVVGKLGDGGAR